MFDLYGRLWNSTFGKLPVDLTLSKNCTTNKFCGGTSHVPFFKNLYLREPCFFCRQFFVTILKKKVLQGGSPSY